jgi:hypothetical protein
MKPPYFSRTWVRAVENEVRVNEDDEEDDEDTEEGDDGVIPRVEDAYTGLRYICNRPELRCGSELLGRVALPRPPNEWCRRRSIIVLPTPCNLIPTKANDDAFEHANKMINS